MATVRHVLDACTGDKLSSAFPGVSKEGTNFAVAGELFDAGAIESIYLPFDAVSYGSGNLTVKLKWYAVSATTGVVRWRVAIAAITGETDTQDVSTKALATAQAVDDTHLGTTAKREHIATVTVSNLDSLASGDSVWMQVSREGNHANDTMAGDAVLEKVIVEYSDT